MPQKQSRISQFWQELKRRRVVHVITVYASASFVLIELVNNLTGPLNLPPRLSTIMVIVLAVGWSNKNKRVRITHESCMFSY